MGKVICFGDLMLRLSPPGFERFVQAKDFDATYTGAEANVAVSLANYGLEAYFVSRVPNHEIGQAAINYLRNFGVNTDHVVRGGERLGLFYLEMGASQRASKVVYDRSSSSFTLSNPDDFDWESIMDGASWFHFTGITAALGENVETVLTSALETAKDKGLTVSVDLNYREKLWSSEKANRIMTPLMEYVDVLIGNEEDAEKTFGITAGHSNVTSGRIDEQGYLRVAKELMKRFDLENVAITLRESLSASINNWSALLCDRSGFHRSKVYEMHIVDRVGGGDSFSGGLIYSLLTGKSLNDAVEFAAAASCLKHSIFGDFNLVSLDEVEYLVSGDESGRVQR